MILKSASGLGLCSPDSQAATQQQPSAGGAADAADEKKKKKRSSGSCRPGYARDADTAPGATPYGIGIL